MGPGLNKEKPRNAATDCSSTQSWRELGSWSESRGDKENVLLGGHPRPIKSTQKCVTSFWVPDTTVGSGLRRILAACATAPVCGNCCFGGIYGEAPRKGTLVPHSTIRPGQKE